MIRKIMSQEELQKKRERNNRIMVIILGLILLFSTAGYFASDYASNGSEKIEYRNIEFKQNDYGYWAFEINQKEYVTLYNPLQTQNVSILAEKSIGEYANKILYFETPSSESYSEGARTEIINNLNSIIIKTNFACRDNTCTDNYPVKNCSSDNLILFENTNTSRVGFKDKCIILEYRSGEAELVADAFVYRLLGLQ